eukprot:TRINITY_DN2987_c0_g1_i2.p2 TRINITY_DN2987_c0_g1~~TRINITY_DN2987_c0_g1_i2.p2  ORF type:complete len:246 (-),score=57.83 TRINITY_DN2987_c0_g1_i2:97-834(-)
MFFFFFFQAEDGIRDVERSRGLGDVYKRQVSTQSTWVYNKELTDLLCNVDISDEIPTELYETVAHIIAFVTDLDKTQQKIIGKFVYYFLIVPKSYRKVVKMALYTISDLHLGFNVEKPMDIFGEIWKGHSDKIKKNWLKKISKNDMILIAGDISWSLKADDSVYDLDWIDALPGKKIISKGNHDYWWTSISKLNAMYDNTKFLQNNYYTYENYAICGTRGWSCPCLLYTSPSPRDLSTSRMPSSA